VCQTEEVHAEIQSLLGQLRRLRNATTLSVQGVPVSPQSHDAEGKAMRALETKIDIDVRGKPLAETLAVFRGQLNIRFISERKSLEEIGFDSAEPMTVRASGIAASSAIETLCRLNGFAWMIVDGGVVITSHDDVSNSLRMKFYDVRDFAPPRRAPVARDFESLIRAITTYIEPKTWDEFGGPGSIAPYVSNGITALVISQTWQVHDKVAALLAQLRAIRQSGRAATGKAFAAPVVSAWEKRIREALTRPVPLGFAGKPLSEVIAALRDFLRAEIQLDSRALAEARVASDPRITVDQPGISARSLLDAIVTPHKLAWTVRDETIWITTPAEECDHFLVSWVYDVAGLAGAGKQADFERLIGRITHAVAPDSWEHRGGNGSADPFVAHGITALLVSQTWRNQCKIEELLSAIAKEPALTEPLKR
jgi:hypothetical protein